jgi:hypothetical protein
MKALLLSEMFLNIIKWLEVVKFWSVLFESLGCNSESHVHVNIMIIVDQRKYLEASLLTAIWF